MRATFVAVLGLSAVGLVTQADTIASRLVTIVDQPRDIPIIAAGDIGRRDLERTMRAVETAFVADDPVDLYPLMSRELRDAYKSEAFADSWRAQAATIGHVTAMRAKAISEPRTNELGFVFVVVTYEVDRLRPTGIADTTTFDVYYVREGELWKLLLSRAR